MNTPLARSVRRATRHDVGILAHFRYAFRSNQHPTIEDRDAFLLRCVEWMQPRLHAESRWRVWLLDQGSEPIGNVWVQFVEKIPNPGRESELHAYLSSLFVLPDHRNTGAGSLLLETAIAECRALSVDSIFLWPSDESRSLYRRHGFAVTDDVLVNKLQ